MSKTVKVALAAGDGIGPEITDAVLRIFDAAGVPLEYEAISLGKAAYEKGFTSGVPDSAWDVIRESGVILKGPITTPQGGGFKSVNVTLRTSLGLFANVRPCVSYSQIPGSRSGIDMVIVRENEEDLYTGIEHRQTPESVQCLKLVTRSGCERIIRYAFAYAQAHGRKKVTCMSKDNIMKMTDGLFHRIFDEVAKEYPDIKTEHQIIDIGTARIAVRPEAYDIVVTLNLYGDILSDVAAEVAGSVGLGYSSNIGPHAAMFEAIHGSAPDIAGRNIANPSGLLLAGVQMLLHLGLSPYAEKINNAWLKALDDDIHTVDLHYAYEGVKPVGTVEFAQAVIDRLGQTGTHRVHYGKLPKVHMTPLKTPEPTKQELVGCDVFLQYNGKAEVLGTALEGLAGPSLKLEMISNRGVVVYPKAKGEVLYSDHWRCRLVNPEKKEIPYADILTLLSKVDAAAYKIIKTENLYLFDGKPGYSAGQGQ